MNGPHYVIEGYAADDVKPPREPGDVVCRAECSVHEAILEAHVRSIAGRPDVGPVAWWKVEA